MEDKKLEEVLRLIKAYKKAAVAFSGGVDSTLLLRLCCEAMGKGNVLAVTGVSQTYTEEEKSLAQQLSREFGVTHLLLTTDELRHAEFAANPGNRCYYCKRELYEKIREAARNRGIDQILDATNADDLQDYRPGRKAAAEWGVRSPFEEAGITKEDIRKWSKIYGLVTWNKPSNPCLASRIPYGTRITEEVLKMVASGERILHESGFPVVRLRHHGECARIEIRKEDLITMVCSERLEQIIHGIKGLGYRYVTLDLEGYRTGSLNEALKENES